MIWGDGLGQKREKKLNSTTWKKKKVYRLVAEGKKNHQQVGQEKKNSTAGWPGKKTTKH